jgi:hypothetical protein
MLQVPPAPNTVDLIIAASKNQFLADAFSANFAARDTGAIQQPASHAGCRQPDDRCGARQQCRHPSLGSAARFEFRLDAVRNDGAPRIFLLCSIDE